MSATNQDQSRIQELDSESVIDLRSGSAEVMSSSADTEGMSVVDPVEASIEGGDLPFDASTLVFDDAAIVELQELGAPEWMIERARERAGDHLVG